MDCLRFSLQRLAMLTDEVYSGLPSVPPSETSRCFAQALHETQIYLVRLEYLNRTVAMLKEWGFSSRDR